MIQQHVKDVAQGLKLPDCRFAVQTKSCPVESFFCPNSENATGLLQPCLRHTRIISQSCDNLITTASVSSQVALQTIKPVLGNGSLCGSSSCSKSVKFLLPGKNCSTGLYSDERLRRFSMGSFVPTQFMAGQNFDQYLWTSGRSRCNHCHSHQMPYFYNFRRFNSHLSLQRTSRPISIERTNSTITKMLNYHTTSEQEGTLLY